MILDARLNRFRTDLRVIDDKSQSHRNQERCGTEKRQRQKDSDHVEFQFFSGDVDFKPEFQGIGVSGLRTITASVFDETPVEFVGRPR